MITLQAPLHNSSITHLAALVELPTASSRPGNSLKALLLPWPGYTLPRSLVLKWPKLPTRTDHQKDRDTFSGYPVPYFSISPRRNNIRAFKLPRSGIPTSEKPYAKAI
ncbi:hypothetical protein QYF36_015402 [Acer negundo]|nr:hypothetical protein QYF36_015402 [Acer negundo]